MDTRATTLDASAQRMLARFRAAADLFDNKFRVPGTNFRFGIDPLIGLVPGLGDVAGAAFAVWSVVLARKLGAPGVIQTQMLANIALDMVGGSVPIFGDIFDLAFKAHARNRKLLDAWLDVPDAAIAATRRSMVRNPLLLLGAVMIFGLLAAAFTIWLALKFLGFLMASGSATGA
jgi:hypothetical protein